MSELLGVNLFIKRDDFTGISLFGGNKVRKLEYLLGQAQASGATYVITYGATQSNHAMETAAACRRLGIQPILYLTAVVPPRRMNCAPTCCWTTCWARRFTSSPSNRAKPRPRLRRAPSGWAVSVPRS
jgi:1-aminocyclopropane-1-carboxylate deaminase/D-cysteine desulfhydrase-like pyridoxal-dependent ACC family enzyme